MARQMQDAPSAEKVKEAKKEGKVFNHDVEVEWVADTKNHKAGEKSVVNHAMADKLKAMGRVKIGKEVPRAKLRSTQPPAYLSGKVDK